MCSGRPRHHIEEEKRRAAAIMAGQRAQAERERRAQEERMRQMQEQAMKAQEALLQQVATSMKQPVRTRTQEAAGTPLMRTQQKTATARRGVASLRIARTPGINVAGGQTGINLG